MAASYINPAFEAPTLSTRVVAATGTSASIQYQSSNLSSHVRIVNVGTATAFVEFGESSGVTAIVPTGTAVGSIPITSGGLGAVVLRARHNWVAMITSGTTATTVYITPGDGGL